MELRCEEVVAPDHRAERLEIRCFSGHDARVVGHNVVGVYEVEISPVADSFEQRGRVEIPVVIGRGGPRMVPGFMAMRETLESLGLPYVMFGHDTPLTMVAEYAANLDENLQLLLNRAKSGTYRAPLVRRCTSFGSLARADGRRCEGVRPNHS